MMNMTCTVQPIPVDQPEAGDPIESPSGGLKRDLRTLLTDESGATTLEWSMLLAAIAIPSYFIIELCVDVLVGHYQMMTMLNSLPFP